jgi:hypothetical protein
LLLLLLLLPQFDDWEDEDEVSLATWGTDVRQCNSIVVRSQSEVG